MRDTKLRSTNTIWAAVLLVVAGTTGNHFAQKLHEAGKPPSTIVEVGGPAVGVAVGVVLIFLIRLLLTFRVQRNEARNALLRGTEQVRAIRGQYETLKADHEEALRRASAAEAKTAIKLEMNFHGEDPSTFKEVFKTVVRSVQAGEIDVPLLPDVTSDRPKSTPELQAGDDSDDDQVDGASDENRDG